MRLSSDALASSRSCICPQRSFIRPSISQSHRLENLRIRLYTSAAVRAHAPDTSADDWAPPKSIGIIGGGISGLATAYYIQERWKHAYLPMPKVTIYEDSDRLGGWIGSEKVDTPSGHIRIEQGPRTLAASPAGMATMDMIEHIGILDSVRWVKKDDPSAQNRYIYDGGEDLKRVPTNMGAFFWDVISVDSVMLPAMKHGFLNFFRKMPELPVDSDTSLGQSMSKIVGEETVNTLLSSFIHGIYAGNVWNLSTRAKGPWSTVLSQLRGQPKSIKDVMFSKPNMIHAPFWVGPVSSWTKDFDESFVFYLKEGLQLLPLALESFLRMESKTDIQMKTNIRSVSADEDGSISVTGTNDDQSFTHSHDYVVSAIPPNLAHKILDPPPPWKDIQSVSVGTVTFFWPDKFPIKYDGFGYVISQATPMEQNPHGALGVIFDSATRPSQDKAAGQKVTVLLGGEYWAPGLKKGVALPTKEELISQAKETLEIQLGVNESAEYITASIMPECIPQPSVDFMKSVHSKANPAVRKWAEAWNRKLLLAGPPVFGPGVHDCVNGAYTTVTQLLVNEVNELARKSKSAQDPKEAKFFEEWVERGSNTVWTDLGYVLLEAHRERRIEERAVEENVSEDEVTGGKDMLWPPQHNRGMMNLLMATVDVNRHPSKMSSEMFRGVKKD